VILGGGLQGDPSGGSQSIDENLEIVQIAVTLGTLLNAFQTDDGVIGW
jgi:hypothetical protein